MLSAVLFGGAFHAPTFSAPETSANRATERAITANAESQQTATQQTQKPTSAQSPMGIQQSLTDTQQAAMNNPQTPPDRLITPTDYEQYLPLTKPMDVAVSGDYTAIADGNVIYVYNRFEGVYKTYTHVINTDPNMIAMNVVTELQFSDDGDLYFIDGVPYLHVLTREQLSSLNETTVATNTNFTCSSFTIEGETMYFTHISGQTATLSYAPLNDLTASSAKELIDGLIGKPIIAYYDEAIYYTNYSISLNKIDVTEKTSEPVCSFATAVDSLIISSGDLFITNTSGDFYVYNLSRLEYAGLAQYVTPTESDERGGYRALSLQGNNVYAIRNESIREYRIGDGFTSYEISANSDAPHRLNGATDSLYIGGKLYSADKNNSRISIRNTATGEITTAQTPSEPIFVASDGNSFAGANETQVWLFDGGITEPIAFDNFNGKIVGITCVYNRYYLVTDTNHYYVIEYLPMANPDSPEEKTNEFAWQKTGGKEKTTKLSPALLSSDVYGNIYVAAKTGDLYKLTETEFPDPDSTGKKISNPTLEISLKSADKFLIDLNENVYILKDNRLVRYDYDKANKVCTNTVTAYELGKSLVYGQTDSTAATSVAFDCVDEEIYLTYAGNLVISTNAIPLATMKNVFTNGIEQEIFSASTAEFTIVETSANALLIAFDLEAFSKLPTGILNNAFPYESYHRDSESRTALKLGSVGEYAIVAIFDSETHTYTNYITNESYFVAEKSPNEYLLNYKPGEEKTGYLTNAVTLYKYPYLTKLLQVTGLTKNQEVTLIGEINQLDYNYYRIEFVDENGVTQTGFIPQTYITLFNGEPLTSEQTTYAEKAPNEDELWRLTFLLLGAAAIGILVDLLILHRTKED